MKRKYNILFLALLAFPGMGLSQQHDFVINGKIDKKESPAKAYLRYVVGGTLKVDSARVNDGMFSFKGSVNDPTKASVYLDYSSKGISDRANFRDFLTCYLANGTITISTQDSLKNAKITGSKINDEYHHYTSITNAANREIDGLRRAAGTDPALRKDFQAKMKALEDKKTLSYLSYVKAYPNSFFSLEAVQNLLYREAAVDVLEQSYSVLSANHKSSQKGEQLNKSIQSYKLTAVGNPVMDFTQNDVNNKPVSTKDFRGKYLLIDFWASWCGPCRAENPHLVKAYEAYRGNGFEILGVSLDDANKRDAWLKAIADDGLLWTQVSDLKGWKNEAGVLYGIRSIPSNFLIDPDGKIIARNLRGMQVQEKLKEIFNK